MLLMNDEIVLYLVSTLVALQLVQIQGVCIAKILKMPLLQQLETLVSWSISMIGEDF